MVLDPVAPGTEVCDAIPEGHHNANSPVGVDSPAPGVEAAVLVACDEAEEVEVGDGLSASPEPHAAARTASISATASRGREYSFMQVSTTAPMDAGAIPAPA
jgi:hypothetical protein